MYNTIYGTIFSFVLSMLLFPVIIRIAQNKHIIVKRHFRHSHHHDISSLGGIALFTGTIASLLVFGNFSTIHDMKYYLAAGFFVFLLGLRDDIQAITPWQKLAGQTMAALFITIPGNFRIRYLPLIFEQNTLPPALSVALSVFVILWFINAYNFFDGIDFQAALTAMIILLPAAFWFYYTRQYNFSLLLFSLESALLSFIFYNYSPSKIMMGDTGTVSIGFILAFVFIKFINIDLSLSSGHPFFIHRPFLVGIAAFGLPLFDSIRVVFVRLLHKKAPQRADKNHFHHLLLKLRWKQNHIAMLSGGISLLLILLNYWMDRKEIPAVLCLTTNLLLLTTPYLIIVKAIEKRSSQQA